MGGGQAAELGEDVEGCGWALLGEVAGGLVGEEHADEEDGGGEGLQRERHDVLGVAVDVEEGAIVYPECDLLDACQFDGRWRSTEVYSL